MAFDLHTILIKNLVGNYVLMIDLNVSVKYHHVRFQGLSYIKE